MTDVNKRSGPQNPPGQGQSKQALKRAKKRLANGGHELGNSNQSSRTSGQLSRKTLNVQLPVSPTSYGGGHQGGKGGTQNPPKRVELRNKIVNALKPVGQQGTSKFTRSTGKQPEIGGAILNRTGNNDGGASSENGFLFNIASYLADAIIGETPGETLARGHSAAAVAAEKQIQKTLLKNSKAKGQLISAEKSMEKAVASAGIPLNVNSRFPKTKMSISLSKKRMPGGSGNMTAVVNLKGTDYLSDVEVAASSTQGTILFDTLIHPRAFPGTRIAAFSGLFDKYVYKKFTVKYNPSAPADDAGILVGFCDYDPDEDMISAFQENVRKAASHFGMSFTQTWKNDSWTLKELQKDALYFCEPSDSEDRLVFQGRYILLQAYDEDSSPANVEKGLLSVDYDIDFYISQLTDTPPLTTNAYCEWTGDASSETANIPFGTAPVLGNRSNVNITYAVRSFSGTNRGVFTLPEAAVTTTWLVVVMMKAVTLSVPNLGWGNLVTALTAYDSALTTDTHWTGVYYYTQATSSPNGENLLLPYLTTFGGATLIRITFTPLPTAIALQHNNRKELLSEVDDLKRQVEEFKVQVDNLLSASKICDDKEDETKTDNNSEANPVPNMNWSPPVLAPQSIIPAQLRSAFVMAPARR